MALKDVKTIQIDPLSEKLTAAGFEGGASKKLGNIKLKRVKKIIQKTPNKNFKDYEKSGKDRKKYRQSLSNQMNELENDISLNITKNSAFTYKYLKNLGYE